MDPELVTRFGTGSGIIGSTWRSLMCAKTRRASILRMPAISWTRHRTSSACRRMPGWAAIDGSMCHAERIYMIFLSEVLYLFGNK